MKILNFALASLLAASLQLHASGTFSFDGLSNDNFSNGGSGGRSGGTSIEPVTPSNRSNDQGRHHHHQEKQKTTANHVSAFNNFAVATTLTLGQLLPFNNFNTLPVESGAVVQTAIDTFTITQSGHYYINVTADALFPTTGSGIALLINGVVFQPSQTPQAFDDTPLIITQIVPIIASKSKPATIQVVVQGGSLNFPQGNALQISIFQLSQLGNLK